MTADDLLERALRYLQKTDAVNTLSEDIEKYLEEPKKPMTEEEMRTLFRSTNTAEPLCEGWPGLERFARAIERHHGIGGGDE